MSCEHRYGKEGAVRVIACRPTFAGITDAAVNQIRQNSASSVAVSLRLLETVAAVGPHTRTHSQRAALAALRGADIGARLPA